MKENLIRLTDEDNLFYDSEDRLYRYRMNCPYCGKYSGCRCFPTLEKVEDFVENGVNFLCSSKCFLIDFINEQGIDEVGEAIKELGRGNYLTITNKKETNKLKRIFNKIKKNIRFLINYNIKYYFSTWRIKWYIFRYTGYISENDSHIIVDEMDLDFDFIEGESC